MSEDHTVETPEVQQDAVFDQPRLSETPLIPASIVGILAFAIAGLAVTSVLFGQDVPQSGIAAYLVNGQIIAGSHHSLDLSRPIFVRPQVPICPTEDALAAYSRSDPQGCTLVRSGAPAGLMGMLTNGMQQPTFEMRLTTSSGTIKGWVNYNNLTN
jgi:hypothetical protein